MTYAAPTAEHFKARFPEFDAVSDTLCDFAIEEAGEAVGDNWPDTPRFMAHRLYAAHILAVEGEPERSLTISAAEASGETAQHMVKDVLSVKVDDTAWTFGDAREVENGFATSAGNLASTRYGREFLTLRGRYFVGVTTV